MLGFFTAELPKVLTMLEWLEDHKKQFSELVELPAQLGANPGDTDIWGMRLLDLVAEQFGLTSADGALERWDQAKVETINEAVQDGDYEGCARIEKINRRVYNLLSDIPY